MEPSARVLDAATAVGISIVTSTDVAFTGDATTTTDVVSTIDVATSTDVVTTADAATSIGSSVYARPTESEKNSLSRTAASTGTRPLAVTPTTDNRVTAANRVVAEIGPKNASPTVAAGNKRPRTNGSRAVQRRSSLVLANPLPRSVSDCVVWLLFVLTAFVYRRFRTECMRKRFGATAVADGRQETHEIPVQITVHSKRSVFAVVQRTVHVGSPMEREE